jgi:hypothetical protein
MSSSDPGDQTAAAPCAELPPLAAALPLPPLLLLLSMLALLSAMLLLLLSVHLNSGSCSTNSI